MSVLAALTPQTVRTSPHAASAHYLDPAPMDDPDDPRVGTLRCLTCGKATDCTGADLARFRQTGWPVCCGVPVSLFTTTPPAESDD